MKKIVQKVLFSASPHDVYEALMDQKKHAAFTGGSTKISRKEGGSFSVFDGYAKGKNIKLVKDKLIVQSWKASDWNAKASSEVRFEFKKKGKGTELIFTHVGIPDEHAKSITQGWKDYYWTPMKEMFKEK